MNVLAITSSCLLDWKLSIYNLNIIRAISTNCKNIKCLNFRCNGYLFRNLTGDLLGNDTFGSTLGLKEDALRLMTVLCTFQSCKPYRHFYKTTQLIQRLDCMYALMLKLSLVNSIICNRLNMGIQHPHHL